VTSRLVARLAGDAPAALTAIRTARAAARERAWQLAGTAAPGAVGELIPVDIDATVVTAHCDGRGDDALKALIGQRRAQILRELGAHTSAMPAAG